MHRSLATLLAAAALAATAPAQFAVTASGRVVAAPASPCNAAATHTFQCGDLLLHSTSVNLAALQNRYVVVTGQLDAQPGCLTLNVDTAVETTTRLATLTFTNYRIGSAVTLLSTAPLGAVIVHLFSVETGVLPLGPFGTLWLNPLSTTQWAFDFGIGLPFPRVLNIPNNPGLVGCSPNFQSLVVDPAAPQDSRLTNDACFVIRQ